MKLLCLPYAGASATIYYKFKKYLDKNIDLIPIELPGRGMRSDENLILSFEEVLNDVVKQINRIICEEDKYMIFGYSLGSLLAYEAIKRVKHLPEHIFLAAFQPPIYETNSDILELEDEMFLKELVENGGIDSDLTEDFDILKQFIPIIKADFSVVADYKYSEEFTKLNCNATILYTLDDNYSDKISKWDDYFINSCEYIRYSGNHFFIKRDYREIVKVINTKNKI